MRTGQNRFLADRLNGMIERTIRRACEQGGLVEQVTAGQTRRQRMDHAAMTAGIVLKAPRCEAGQVVEKGVLLLKNSNRIDSFRRSVDIAAALRELQTSSRTELVWATRTPRLLAYTTFRNHIIFVMSPCQADYEFLRRLDTNLQPIAIGASDWV